MFESPDQDFGKGSAILPEVRLAIALRYYAGGAVLDLHDKYDLSPAEAYDSITRCTHAINIALPVEYPIDDPRALERISQGFANLSPGKLFQGCTGAIDGVFFKQRSPGKAVDNPARYYVGRKCCFALLCVAVCDADRRFLFFDISANPNAHDSSAFASSDLGQWLAAGRLEHPGYGPFFLNGDNAYALAKYMVCPTGKKATAIFDYVQSSVRMPIECAFGILIRRWGLLWRPLEMRFEMRAQTITALMRLHNFCIDERLGAACLDVGEIKNGQAELSENCWCQVPLFGSNGRPLHYMTAAGPCPAIPTALPVVPPPANPRSKSEVRDALVAAIEASPRARAIYNARRQSRTAKKQKT